MNRGVGLTELLSALPGVVVLVFAVVTQLGDFWFTLSLTALCYWLGSRAPRIGAGLTRERAIVVVALLTCAVAVTVSLKSVFGLPRPPGAGTAPYASQVPTVVRELYVSMATGDGYGFPSGHATTTTLVWGGLAWAVRVGSERQRVLVAAAVTAFVGFSRLVLGVHYLADVLAGFVVGIAVLWLAVGRLRTPGRVFGLAAAVALVGLIAGGVTRDGLAALAMAAVGAIVWRQLGGRVDEPSRRGAAVTATLGACIATLALTVVGVVGAGPVVVPLLAGVGTGLLVALPLVGERVAKKSVSRSA